MSIASKMTAIADKIRGIVGTSGAMGLDSMANNLESARINIANSFSAVGNKGGTVPSSKSIGNLPEAIRSIPEGVDTSDATAVARDILSGKTAYNSEGKITGTILDRNTVGKNGVVGINEAYPTIASVPTIDNIQMGVGLDGVQRLSVRTPAGYYNGESYVSIPTSVLGTATANQVLSGATFTSSAGIKQAGTIATVTQATPSISVNASGLITASATQSAGYVSSGTKSSTKQLTVQAAQTITPGTSNKTIASGRYLTGVQTIKGDSNLVAGNIKKGVSIFGVTGTHNGLNFAVVGGTTAPSSPQTNTIWVNTSTAITDVVFSAEAPTNLTAGRVWIVIGDTSPVKFYAAEAPYVGVYPLCAKQYVNDAWVDVTAKSWIGGQWVDWVTYMYRNGNLSYYMDSKGLKPTSSYSGDVSGVTITNTGSSYYIDGSRINGSYPGGGVAYFTTKVDLTNASTLYVNGDFLYGSSKAFPYIGIWSSFGSYANTNRVMGVSPCNLEGDNTTKTVAIDVSSLTGSYYIGFCLYTDSVYEPCSVVIHEVYYK